jgi:hypothetical protein
MKRSPSTTKINWPTVNNVLMRKKRFTAAMTLGNSREEITFVATRTFSTCDTNLSLNAISAAVSTSQYYLAVPQYFLHFERLSTIAVELDVMQMPNILLQNSRKVLGSEICTHNEGS